MSPVELVERLHSMDTPLQVLSRSHSEAHEGAVDFAALSKDSISKVGLQSSSTCYLDVGYLINMFSPPLWRLSRRVSG